MGMGMGHKYVEGDGREKGISMYTKMEKHKE